MPILTSNYLQLNSNFVVQLRLNQNFWYQSKHKKNEEHKKTKNINNHQRADNILARSNIRIINPSLDSFIKVKMPQMKDEMILPKQKEINLNEPSLKTKGIENKYIEKKKNIYNIYEDDTKK